MTNKNIPDPQPSPYLDVEQVAVRIGLSIDATYRLLKSGRIRSYRVGMRQGRYRVTVAQVEKYLKSCETTPMEDRPVNPKVRPRPKFSGRPDGLPYRHLD